MRQPPSFWREVKIAAVVALGGAGFLFFMIGADRQADMAVAWGLAALLVGGAALTLAVRWSFIGFGRWKQRRKAGGK